MKASVILGCLALLTATLCQAAETGVVTVLDGSARLLRGSTWYKLVEGARVQDGDVIEAAERAQVQLEVATGDVINAAGPASLLLTGVGPRGGKLPGAVELYLPQGWVKLAAKPPSRVGAERRAGSRHVAATSSVAAPTGLSPWPALRRRPSWGRCRAIS